MITKHFEKKHAKPRTKILETFKNWGELRQFFRYAIGCILSDEMHQGGPSARPMSWSRPWRGIFYPDKRCHAKASAPFSGELPSFWAEKLGSSPEKTGELPRKNWGAPQKKLGSLPEKLGFENPGQDKSDFTNFIVFYGFLPIFIFCTKV